MIPFLLFLASAFSFLLILFGVHADVNLLVLGLLLRCAWPCAKRVPGTMSTEDNGGVRYTVKELVQDLTRTIADDRRETLGMLARIEGKLDAKADRATVDGIEKRVAVLELANAATPGLSDAFKALDAKNVAQAAEIAALKAGQAGDEKVGRYKRWLIGICVALLGTVVALVALIVGVWPQ
jgi:hypothetical protein